MAEKPSDKSKYLSKYAPETYVTAAQYIAELVCEKMANQQKVVLKDRFWTQKEWARTFVHQAGKANHLLKKYDALAIIKALKAPQAKKIYSLGALYVLTPLIEKEQAILDKGAESKVEVTHNVLDKPRQPAKNKNSLYGKLTENE